MDFDLVCKGGFYGLKCSESCGNCKAGAFCNKMTGACPDGCKDHWNGTKCDGKTITCVYVINILVILLQISYTLCFEPVFIVINFNC